MMMMMTCAEVKSHATKEVVADESVEVPDGQLHTAVLELDPGEALEDERVVPGRVTVALNDGTLVCGRARSIRQQATAHHIITEHTCTIAAGCYSTCYFNNKPYFDVSLL